MRYFKAFYSLGAWYTTWVIFLKIVFKQWHVNNQIKNVIM